MNGGPTQGRYEQAENVLHLWYPKPVELGRAGAVAAFYVVEDWVRPCPEKPCWSIGPTCDWHRR
jgi:hypothetical protein